MPAEVETPTFSELTARVVELETEVGRLQNRCDAMESLADRVVTFLKSEHSEAGELAEVEAAAERALWPRP